MWRLKFNGYDNTTPVEYGSETINKIVQIPLKSKLHDDSDTFLLRLQPPNYTKNSTETLNYVPEPFENTFGTFFRTLTNDLGASKMESFSPKYNIASSTVLISYPSIPSRSFTCIVLPGEPSDPNPSLYIETDAWLMKNVPKNEVNSITSFAAAQRPEFDGIFVKGYFSISHVDKSIGHRSSILF